MTTTTFDPRATGKYTHRSACPVCAGSGWDDAFNCECNCDLQLAPTGAFVAAAQKAIGANVADRIYRPGERLDGRRFGGEVPHRSGPTERQIAFAEKTLRRYWPDKADAKIAEFKNLTGKQASAALDMMVKRSKTRRPARPQAQAVKPSTGLDLSALPEGRYGVPGGTTRLKVLVQKPDKGDWAGWVFVKNAAVYGNGERFGSQKPGGTYRGKIEDALRAILADPAAAMAEYGHLTDHCGLCNRPLEDPDSVARGIGPKCASKLGW